MKIVVTGLCYFFVFTFLGCTNEGRFFSTKGVKPVKNSLYAEECAACHFAYPPGLLPERSWKKVLAGLEDHFGENAELEQEDINLLFKYLSDNSADNSGYKRSRKIMLSLSGDAAPLRIIKVPYIQKKHREIPKKYVKDNPKVNSLSNCNACHTSADKGIFDDDSVFIPNYGRWDD